MLHKYFHELAFIFYFKFAVLAIIFYLISIITFLLLEYEKAGYKQNEI